MEFKYLWFLNSTGHMFGVSNELSCQSAKVTIKDLHEGFKFSFVVNLSLCSFLDYHESREKISMKVPMLCFFVFQSYSQSVFSVVFHVSLILNIYLRMIKNNITILIKNIDLPTRVVSK